MSLNKAKRLMEERRRRIAANEVLPLDPPFPYRVRPFDVGFFRVGQRRSAGG